MRASFFAAFVIFAFSARTTTPHGLVYVQDCHNQFKPIYADSKETTPLPNPFVSGEKGMFMFFTEGGCIRVKGIMPFGFWEEVRPFSGQNL